MQSFLMTDGIIKMHRSTACYHKAIFNSLLYKKLRNILCYFDFHVYDLSIFKTI